MIKNSAIIFSNANEEDDMTTKIPSTGRISTKNRASRAGARSVASLTPEQLARKRANDREAQRSIRLRTKARIADLEQRIRDLSGDRDDKMLEAIYKRNSELEEELRNLRHLRDTLEKSDYNSASPAGSILVPGLGNWTDQQPHMVYFPNWGVRAPSHEATEIPTSFYSEGGSEELIPSYTDPALGGGSGLNHHPIDPRYENIRGTVTTRATSVNIPILGRGMDNYSSQCDTERNRHYSQSVDRNSANWHPTDSCPQDNFNNTVSFTGHPTDCTFSFNHGTADSGDLLGGDTSPSQIESTASTYNLSNSLPFISQSHAVNISPLVSDLHKQPTQ